MADWDGSGLPPAAHARIERAERSATKTSLLSVRGHVGAGAAGFLPVGDVMGAVAEYIGFVGYGGCGWIVGAPPMRTSLSRYGSSSGYGGFKPYLDAIDAGWNGAIQRMSEECRRIGGDGVIGVTLEENLVGQGVREFVALGTAVRALGNVHLTRPFATGLSGPDLSKLIGAGYVPAAAIVAVSVGVRHDDYYSRMAASAFAPNSEVPAYSELVHAVRSDARDELARRVQGVGADGAILTGDVGLRISELEVSEGHRDHVAEATITATAIVSYRQVEKPPPPQSVLSLRDKRMDLS